MWVVVAGVVVAGVVVALLLVSKLRYSTRLSGLRNALTGEGSSAPPLITAAARTHKWVANMAA